MSISWSIPDDVSADLGCKFGKHVFVLDGDPFDPDDVTATSKNIQIQRYKCKHCSETKEENVVGKPKAKPTNPIATTPFIWPDTPLTVSVDPNGTLHSIVSAQPQTQVVIGNNGNITAPSAVLEKMTIKGKDLAYELELQNSKIGHLENQIKLLTLLVESLCLQKKSSDSSDTSKSGFQSAKQDSEQKLMNS